MEFICLFAPAFISIMILDKKVNFFKKNNSSKIISTYFIYNLLINTIILFITKFLFKTYAYVFTVEFSIKYIFLSVALAIILPISIEKLKQEKDLITTLKKIKFKINNILKKYPKIILFIILTLLFFIIDYFCRVKCFEATSFYEVKSISTNLISLSYSILFSVFIVFLPKILSKIFLIITFILSFLLYLTNYFLLEIKNNAFSIYDFTNAGEGFKFLNFIVKSISFKLILVLLMMITLFVISLLIMKNVKYKRKVSIIAIIIGIVLFLSIRFVGIRLLGDYDPNDWNAITQPKYYYVNFTNQKRSLNVLGIYEYVRRDVALFIKNSGSKKSDIKKINDILNDRGLIKEDNEYTNIFKDKNLIMIMMESIDNVIVNKETMPTLVQMQKNGLNFTNRYGQGISTIATEYTSTTGLYFTGRDYNSYKNTYTTSIPSVFAKNGYTTTFVHENKGEYYNRSTLTKAIGYENSFFLYDSLKKHDYFNDIQLAENNKVYKKIINNKKGKFMTFITTIAGHGPYLNNSVCDLNDKAKLSENNCFRYLAKNTDDFLAKLLERLKEDSLLEDTVIVLFTDHYAYSYGYTKEELKNTYKKITSDYSIKNLPFVIYSPKIKSKKIDNILVNDVDILPTLLNMFGIDYDPNIYIGMDIFSKNHKNLVAFTDYSWYDGKTYSFNEDVEINDEYKQNNKYVKELFNLNNMIVNTDYYKTYTSKQE